MGQGISPEEVQDLITKYDADNSGEIDWPEFLTMMSEIYSGKDIFAKSEKPVEKPAEKPVEKPAEKPLPQVPSSEVKRSNSFQTAKPETSAIKREGSATKLGVQRNGNSKCQICGKTVYPIEGVTVGDRSWHKGCFKCEGEGCTVTLNMKTYTAVNTKVFCQKHVPKEKPTSVSSDGHLIMANAKAAPKLAKVQGISRDARTTFGHGELPLGNLDKK